MSKAYYRGLISFSVFNDSLTKNYSGQIHKLNHISPSFTIVVIHTDCFFNLVDRLIDYCLMFFQILDIKQK